jgi:glycerate kinase
MKIIIAPDSFKGSLTAQEAAVAMAQGVRSALPAAETDLLPMADGGEGSLDALISATNGIGKEIEVLDPLGRPIKGRYGVLGDGKTAVIEMAAVSGLLLLNNRERNPLKTSTYGTGQLIRHALESGFRELVICLGGSSTNDCGTGMAQALGVRFFRKDGSEIAQNMCGELMGEVDSLDVSNLPSAIRQSEVAAACDVRNPLLGEKGTSLIYSPQKGATPEIARRLEENMKSFVEVAEKTTGRRVRDIPGAGAAGGLGAGLMLFLDAELRSGIDIVLDACKFIERIKDADLILTGEGKIDNQTAFGKTIAGIALKAKSANVPVIAFGGIVEDAENLRELGIKKIYPISQSPISLQQSMAEAAVLLQNAVEKAMQEYKGK